MSITFKEYLWYQGYFENTADEILNKFKNAGIIKEDEGGGSRSVHTFVNLETGDILKASSWKAPAPNGKRGNIFNNNSDVGVTIDHHGAMYLK